MTSRDQRFQAALERAGRFFMGTADVQLAADRLAEKLEELGIPYAICGGLAVLAHGHERMTKDVDVLLTPDGLRRFKEEALGRGWLERFPGSNGIRDVDENVPIDVLVTGGYPGDGRPQGVTFPDPAAAAVRFGNKRVLALPRLIELKLARGLTMPDRPRDFDDVIQLIRANRLPEAFEAELHAEVRPKYRELWALAQRSTGEY